MLPIHQLGLSRVSLVSKTPEAGISVSQFRLEELGHAMVLLVARLTRGW